MGYERQGPTRRCQSLLECGYLGCGDYVLGLELRALVGGMGRRTPGVIRGGRRGAGWSGRAFVGTRSRMEREGPYCKP